MEASIQAEYGIDLRHALWGPHPIGARRLLSLVQGLPPGCALHRALDPQGWDWGNMEELTATLVETTDLGNVLFYAAHARKGSPKRKPRQVPRPTRPEPPKKRRQSTVEEIKRFFGGAVRVNKKGGES